MRAIRAMKPTDASVSKMNPYRKQAKIVKDPPAKWRIVKEPYGPYKWRFHIEKYRRVWWLLFLGKMWCREGINHYGCFESEDDAVKRMDELIIAEQRSTLPPEVVREK